MKELGQNEQARLFERFGQTYEAGETIFAEGENADCCFVVQMGRVRLVKKIRSVERSLTLLRDGDLFGEEALLDRAQRTTTAAALSEVRVLALDKETFGVLLAGNAAVASRLVQQLVRRLRDAEEQLENAMLRDHPSRIVNTLIRLAATTEPTGEGYVLQLSPLELSSRVGLDVDTVRRTVQQLRDGGYIRISEERIIVQDLDLLRRLYTLLGMKEDVRAAAP